jgi:hypothetical protein
MATPIESVDKAVTINTQIGIQMVEEQRNTRNGIISEIIYNTNSIIFKIIPPNEERLERKEEGLITLIFGRDSTKDSVLGQNPT